MRALPASAQETCGAEGEIVALADYVLANRSKLPKLQSRRNGAISAYLKIHYQGLAHEQVEATVGPLATANVDSAQDLLLTWRISAAGLDATLSAFPEAAAQLVEPVANASVLRAAVLSGEVPLLFDRIAALPERERGLRQMSIVPALLDLDDESAKAIADEALSRGLLMAAGGLVATHGDRAAWDAFVSRLPSAKDVEAIIPMLYWLPALRGMPALPRAAASDAQGEITRGLFHQATIAAAHTPQRDYLLTYLNQTGDFAGAGAAATMINDLTRDGATIDMETAWLVIYEALKGAAADPKTVGDGLKTIPAKGTRFPGDTVQAVIDSMLAVEAFKSAASGQGAAPDMVAEASQDFVVQLPAWREAAEAIGQGVDLAAFRSSGLRIAIVANLLFANGRNADLAKFLSGTVPNADSIRLAEAFAEALDRRCAGHLAFPGEAVTMPGQPLFRFAPQT